MKCILLGYNHFNFQDEKGKTISGCTVWLAVPYENNYATGFYGFKTTLSEDKAAKLRTILCPENIMAEVNAYFGPNGRIVSIG